tara:strand:- start:368 stop:559 length:192 start_codon:yes stop_codon:yes gene_type:complete
VAAAVAVEIETTYKGRGMAAAAIVDCTVLLCPEMEPQTLAAAGAAVKGRTVMALEMVRLADQV